MKIRKSTNYFGPSAWLSCGRLSDGEAASLPPGEIVAYLEEPCPFISGSQVGDTHSLVFLPEIIGGESFCLNVLRRLVVPGDKLFFFNRENCWYASLDFAQARPTGNWHLLFNGVLPGSPGLTYKKQKRLFRQGGYRSPGALTVISMYFLKARAAGDFVFIDQWGRTAESLGDGLRIRVGIFQPGEICVSSRWCGRRL
jgi:hypothetical protein